MRSRRRDSGGDRADGPDTRPLSSAQRRLWLLEQLHPGAPARIVGIALELRGALDRQALTRAVREVVLRHETLRARFVPVEGAPVQVISEEAEVEIVFTDLRALPSGEREQEVRDRAASELRRPFDLARERPLRVSLFRTDTSRHFLVCTIHHIACDGWSAGIFVDELDSTYRALVRGEPPPLPALRVQYADFARWEQARLAERGASQLAYWRERLDGAPPVLELQGERPRGPVADSRASSMHFEFPAGLGTQLETLAARERVSLFMVVFAGFQIVLNRLSGAQDLVTGVPVSTRGHSDFEPLIGFFLNTLPLRVRVSGEPRFVDVLRSVRGECLAAYANQDVPFERIVEAVRPRRDPAYHPLIQTMFAFQEMGAGTPGSDDLEVRSWNPREQPAGDVSPCSSELDLTLCLSHGPNGLGGDLEYRRALFGKPFAEQLLSNLEAVLRGASSGTAAPLRSPQRPPSEPARELLPQAVHEAIAARAEERPDAVALVCADRTLRYRELDEATNRLARYLVGAGVASGETVALGSLPPADAVVAALAVLKAGAACGVSSDVAGAEVRADRRLELGLAALDELPEDRLAELPASALAYVVHAPDAGLEVDHQGLAATVRRAWASECFSGAEEVVSTSVPGSDWWLIEVLGPLVSGARLVVEPSKADGASTARIAFRGRLPGRTPDAGASVFPGLLPAWARRERMPGAIGAYGSSTAGLWAAVDRAEDAAARPILAPLPGRELYVVDDHGQPVRPGILGRLCVASTDSTASFPRIATDKAAASADGAPGVVADELARLRDDGLVEILGEATRVLRLRGGVVVAPTLVESVLAQHPGICDVVLGEVDGRLVAYVAVGDGRVRAQDIERFSAGRLARHLVPEEFVFLRELPRTAAGMLLREALPVEGGAAAGGLAGFVARAMGEEGNRVATA